jgi:hypothetical protein
MDTLMAVMRAGTANSFIVQAWKWVEEYGEKGTPVAMKDLRLFQQAAAARGVRTAMLDDQLARRPPAPSSPCWTCRRCARCHLLGVVLAIPGYLVVAAAGYAVLSTGTLIAAGLRPMR